MENLIGSFMTPSFSTIEEFEEGYKKSIFYTKEDFKNEYEKHIAAMSHISECSKIFISKNYEKIENWNDLNVAITDGRTGDVVKFYNHKPERYKRQIEEDSTASQIFKRVQERRAKEHNPIMSLTKVILDPSDGDFSITINGKDFYWIDDESIIIIADYIESKLKIKTDE